MFEESNGKRVKRLVDSIPKAHTWLPDGMVALGVRNCSCKRADGAYTLGCREPKRKYRLTWLSILDLDFSFG